MDLQGKKVLVTGASGFIGSHLTEKLVELGADTSVFLRYTSDGRIGNLKYLPADVLKSTRVFRGDLKSADGVYRAAKGADVIFHLGASISIPYSYIDPRDFIDTNVTGTLNVLRATQECDVKKVITTSTSEVYGTAVYTPIDEKHPLQPQSPYAASKVGSDKLAESFYKSFDLPVAIIRPFNTYGPRQSARAVIPTIITQALISDKIKIGSLSPERDFTYVGDSVNGFVQIAESENSTGEVINIGSGESMSIGNLIKIIGSILGRDLESIVEIDEERIRPEKSEVMLLLCDNSKAKRLLGWEPKISLEEGLRRTIEYIRQNIDDYQIGEYQV